MLQHSASTAASACPSAMQHILFSALSQVNHPHTQGRFTWVSAGGDPADNAGGVGCIASDYGCLVCAVGSTFLLYAAGLGRAESAATASAINWIVKDGIGQAGTLVTARMFSHDFDLNTRSWYIFANVLACLAAVAEVCFCLLSWFTTAELCFHALAAFNSMASNGCCTVPCRS